MVKLASVFLILAFLSTMSLVQALQVERPDQSVQVDRVLGSNNAGTVSDAGVSLAAYVGQYIQNDGSPYWGDYVSMNVSMAANTRRGIVYTDSGLTSLYPSISWIFDTNLGGVYDWKVEYPNLGDDYGFWVDLPLDHFLVFYGVRYQDFAGDSYPSHIWICINGFACLDNSNSTSRGPAAIPSPDKPNAVFAPFWTDLLVDSQSKIIVMFKHHYGPLDYFTVIWDNALEKVSNARCTFGLSFRVYHRDEELFSHQFRSGDVWFYYKSLPSQTSSFVYGLEDQAGCKGNGALLPGNQAANFNGNAICLYNVYAPYIKTLALKIADSNPNSHYDIIDSATYGSGVRVNGAQPDSNGWYLPALWYAVHGAATIGGWLLRGTTYAGFFGPAGAILLAADFGSWVYSQVCADQHGCTGAVFQDNKKFNPPKDANIPDAHVQAPAYDNRTGQSDNVLDACLETWFDWVCYDDYASNHTLTITATVEYGYWDDPHAYTYTASTSVSVDLFANTNNSTANARTINYGSYGQDPMLYIGGIHDTDDYYKIQAQQNTGTIVEVFPPTLCNVGLYVMDSNGNVVDWQDRNGIGGKEEVRFVAAYTGTYYIRVQEMGGPGFYNLTISHGWTLTVSAGYGGTTSPGPGTYVFKDGEVALVNATANQGYVLSHWQTDWYPNLSIDNPLSVTMHGNHAVTAYFTVPGSGGGGSEPCPGLLVWNGSAYLPYGIINVHNPTGEDVVRQVSVSKQDVNIENYTARLMLVEGWVGLNFSESVIDQVRLYAVDCFGNRYLCPLVSAVHSREGNVLLPLLFSDDWRTQILLHERIDLTFLTPYPTWLVRGYTFEIEGCNRFKV